MRDNTINIEEQLLIGVRGTEALLREYMPESDAKHKIIHEAMRYSLLDSGKRIRPCLAMMFSLMASYKSGRDPHESYDAALTYGCALEMIHTYSLIHDDLPCMDNDDLRRGKPTNHKVFGEANALLAGDGLLTRAFGVAASNPHADAESNCKAVMLLSQCAGADGMIGGQVLDLMGETEKFGIEELELMQSLKTGELIRCAVLLGCLAGGASDKLSARAEKYALYIGRAFQVIDDILDVVGDEKVLGKPIGSDEKSGKSTFATVMTIEEAKKYAKELTESAKAAISKYAGSELPCALADYLLTRNM